MAFATAQREANLEKGQDDLKLLKKAIYDAPIILCSTHGHYDRKTDPVKWIVPPNTFIFEAQTIGDLTLTLLDKPLWDLLQGGMRWGLYKYITGKYKKISREGIEVYDVFKQALASMIMYKPGDEIFERVLSIGGGRHQEDASARALLEGMGFFRYDPTIHSLSVSVVLIRILFSDQVNPLVLIFASLFQIILQMPLKFSYFPLVQQ